MHIKSQRDFLSGLLFIVVGVAVAVGASTYPMGSSETPGPGLFPLVMAVLMALLGAVVLFKSLTIETEGGDPIGAIAWRSVGMIVVAICVFGASIERLGLVFAGLSLTLLASLGAEKVRWRGVIANAVVWTAFTWLVFVAWLKLQMPLWPSF